jgi:hypothetical protein
MADEDPPGSRRNLWIWLGISLIGLVVLSIILRLIHGNNSFFRDQQIKTVIAGLIGIAVLVGANDAIIRSTRKIEVQYVIAFDVVIFIVLGLIALISAAPYWGMACLCAGACLFGGGILGLLFGLPLGSETVKSQADRAQIDARKKLDSINLATANAITTKTPDSAPSQQAIQNAKSAMDKADIHVASSSRHNLLSETASTLSKILAGAGLAKFDRLLVMFKTASLTVTRCILGNAGESCAVLGGALILYFGLIGFIAGLVLPAYFMDNWQQGGHPSSDQQQNGDLST